MKDQIAEVENRIRQANNLILILKEEGKRTVVLENAVRRWKLEITSLEQLAKELEQTELELWEA
jgi:hypothetical protein